MRPSRTRHLTASLSFKLQDEDRERPEAKNRFESNLGNLELYVQYVIKSYQQGFDLKTVVF